MDKKIKVTFSEDFKSYGIKKGATREVSEAVARKLYEIYGVIDDPFNQWPPIVSIRLLTKLNQYGVGWYPNSEHLVAGKIAKELVEQGLAERIDDANIQSESYQYDGTESGDHFALHSSFCREHPNIEGIAYWLNSPHNFENEDQKINAIAIAVQCPRSQAEKIYNEILELN